MIHHQHTGASVASAAYTVLLILLAAVYLRGWLRLRWTSPLLVPRSRAASFLIGLALIWVALCSPLGMLDHQLLIVHMIQHLLLMTIAPPLIWLGMPVLPLLNGFLERLVAAEPGKHSTLRAVINAITKPSIAWLTATAVLVGWHIPAIFAFPLQSATWHVVEDMSFLVSGLLFWWPVIQPWPSTARLDVSIILYLFTATLPCDILSAFLVFCDRVVYPVYLTSSQPFGLSALADQQCAGALMWTAVTVVYLIAAAILTTQLLSERNIGAVSHGD